MSTFSPLAVADRCACRAAEARLAEAWCAFTAAWTTYCRRLDLDLAVHEADARSSALRQLVALQRPDVSQ
jgi:hypothetical protein